VRGVQDQPVYLVEELSLSFGGLGKRRGLVSILGGFAIVGHLHQDDVLLIFVGHEDQVFAKIEE
jgi:hypothetical protein